MTEDMTSEAREIAKAIWGEMLAAGYGDKGEVVSDERLDDFVTNQLASVDDWERAARGDVAALAEIRSACHLPIFT